MNARIQWIEEGEGRLGQPQPDQRVVTLQSQINTLLGQVPGAVPIEATGIVDTATCQALAGLLASMDTIRWANKPTPTMVSPIITPSAVFAEAIALCSQWPPQGGAHPPPALFPHARQVVSGDTLRKIGQAVGRVDWQSLKNANPFLGDIGADDLVLTRMPPTRNFVWLPRTWPTAPNGPRPNTLNLPTGVISVPFPAIPITPSGGQNIPRLPFPLPAIPGASPALVLTAINDLSKAGVACGQLAVPNGPLQHVAMAFAAFATVSIAAGGSGQENLDMLEEQLDNLCPSWRGTSPDQPVPSQPTLPPQSSQVANLLSQLVLILAGGANTFPQLPVLAEQATSMGLPRLSNNIQRFAAAQGVIEEPPVGPPPTEPPPGEAPAKKKKGIGGIALAALAVVGVGIAIAVAGS